MVLYGCMAHSTQNLTDRLTDIVERGLLHSDCFCIAILEAHINILILRDHVVVQESNSMFVDRMGMPQQLVVRSVPKDVVTSAAEPHRGKVREKP